MDLARKLDWVFTYVDAKDVYPEVQSGTPWLNSPEWSNWEEPFKTSFRSYSKNQSAKEDSFHAVREAVGKVDDYKQLDPRWLSSLKLYGATLPLAEFAAVIGNLRAARFGRDSAWRTTALFGALDECRHTQIPLQMLHSLVSWDSQFDWTHRFYHTTNWVSVAARHCFDEQFLFSNAIEFAVATNFVFETGFTNLQFVGLSSFARNVGDRAFEKMIQSIQTDEARHSQIGAPVLEVVAKHDKAYAQYLVDKWFWRSWRMFSVVTGLSMDYFTPLSSRKHSFKEFIQEWVLEQFLPSLKRFGLEKPWYWDTFLASLDHYHHMVYLSAYSYRATLWFDFAVPDREEQQWLESKYPHSWPAFRKNWDQIISTWNRTDPDNDWGVHGTSIISFCNLCQLPLCGGTPKENSACSLEHGGKHYVFCSAPCQWIFEKEPERYKNHQNIVDRVLAGKAPGNLVEILSEYFGLSRDNWGRDMFGGRYPWMKETPQAKKAELHDSSIRIS